MSFMNCVKSAALALRATKETAKSIGRSRAALVARGRHLRLELTEIKDCKKTFLLDAPRNPTGLFGDAITMVTARFQELKKQEEALQQFLPRQTQVSAAAGWGQPRLLTSGTIEAERCYPCSPSEKRGGGEVLKGQGRSEDSHWC